MKFIIYVLKTIKYNFDYHFWRRRKIKRAKRYEWFEEFMKDNKDEQ
jgi:hypothetical protein